MDDINKEAFIQSTKNTHVTARFAETVKDAQVQMEKLKGFAQSKNIVVRVVTWMFMTLVIFFFVPIFLTGLLTKGMRVKEQTIMWMAFLIVVVIHFIKSSLF